MRDNELLELLDLKTLDTSPKDGLSTFKSISIDGLGDIRLKAIRFDNYVPVPLDGQFWLKPLYTSSVEDGRFRNSGPGTENDFRL